MPIRRKLADSDEEGYYPESSQAAMKRRRVTIEEDSIRDINNTTHYSLSDNDSNDEEEYENEFAAPSLVFDQPVAPLPVGDDGYVQGSIMKIVLKNFVTYDYCECVPGPQLNMIIGPNGTGKSTIVCAVALGLGGSPQLLGRAKNIAEFVKTGEDNASILIELKQVGEPNVAIQRNINKGNNSSTWKLQGRSASLKEVMSIIAKLNIQVDNLCQFLPQDKVAEFAQLTPPLLLLRTQVAVGDKDLTTWQQQLAEKRRKQQGVQLSHASDVEHMVGLQKRNQLLENDVQKIKERERIKKELQLLIAKLPLAKYSEARIEYEETKEEEKALREQKVTIQRKVAPVERAISERKAANEREINIRNKTTEETQTLKRNLEKVTEEIQRSKDIITEKELSIEGIRRKALRRDEDIKKLEILVAEHEEAVAEEPPRADMQLEKDIKLLSREMDDLEAGLDGVRDNVKDFSRQKAEKERQINMKTREIDGLKDVSRLKLNVLQQYQPDAFKALMWYKENKTLFKGNIYGPLQLCVNVKDKKYASQVEFALGGRESSHLQTFVCEYKEDYQKFTSELVDKQKLRLTSTWPGDIDIDSAIKTPITEHELRSQFGLDHFVINLLEAPPIVLAYLCQQAHINMFPVALQQAGQIETIVERSQFQRFIVGGNQYTVKKYRYGRGGHQTTVKGVGAAKILTDSLDKGALEQKTRELKELQQGLASVEAEIQILDEKRVSVNQKVAELKHKIEDKKAVRNDMLVRYGKWEKLKRSLERNRENLETLRRDPAELEKEIARIKKSIQEEYRRRAQFAGKYQVLLTEYVRKVMERNLCSLQLLSSLGKYEAMRQYGKAQIALLKSATENHTRVLNLLDQRKRAALELKNQAQRAGEDIDEDLKDEFEKILDEWNDNEPGQTRLEIEDDINALQARMDSLKMANPMAVTTYESLTAEIKKLEEKMAEGQRELAILNKEISELHNKWEPRIVSLVKRISEKFSEALARIGCAGEVEIGRDEDYSKWGIEIRVKFRDHEKLQLLTGQRQSGGERAVSTILYLMSLQNLARAPFRVVDEINQGMDPRNERMIHEQIVNAASLPGTPQYFLITPKLLPDLYYNDRMCVLCIYNGEWQPEKMKSTREYLRRAREGLITA